MGLGAGVAPAICEHAVLSRTVELAWPEETPRQIWGNRKTPSAPHDLLELKTLEDCKQIKCVIYDLTQLVFAFPNLARRWIRTNTEFPCTTFEDDDLENVLRQCVEAGSVVGTIDKHPNGRFVLEVDTFTDEMLVAFLLDRLLDVKRGLTRMLPNLRAAYYVLDGKRPVAKSVTAKKRAETKTRNKQYKLREQASKILGPEREWMMKPMKTTKDGQEMWEGSLPDYILNRENLWALVEMLREKMELIGPQTGSGVDVLVARGWHPRYDPNSSWFRVAGDKPDATRPLRDYYSENVDMEADPMMIRLGLLAVRHLQGPCFMSTVDTDIVASMISTSSPNLLWAKNLSFKDRREVVLRTETPDLGSKRKMVPDCIDLQTIYPLKEPKICNAFRLPEFPETFIFSGQRLSDPLNWSTCEAKQRLVAVFVLLMAGCDFCEKLEDFGIRAVVRLLSTKPTLSKVRFSRITPTKNLTREVEGGMLHDCLEQVADAVRFPWRCGNFICLVEVDFESVKTLIESAIKPKRVERRDWNPFIRRLCYSVMTLSAPGLGIEKKVQENCRLALNFGYDSSREYQYVRFEKDKTEEEI